MKIHSIKALEGANIFSNRPVIKMSLHLNGWQEVFTNQIHGFTASLIELLPTLQEHFCSRNRPGGFIERVKEGTLLGHVVEHIALELMVLTGQSVNYGKTIEENQQGIYTIIIEYQNKPGAIQAARSAVGIVNKVLAGTKVSIQDELDIIKCACAGYELGPSTQAIKDECIRRGIPVLRLNEHSLLQLGYGKYQKRIQATITAYTSCIGVDIASDKVLTKSLLWDMGIAVPEGGLAATAKEAVSLAKLIGFPTAVKPNNGNQGKGVSLNLVSEIEVVKAFNFAANYSTQVIVEKFIEGRQLRALVIGNKVEAVALKTPAHIIGDGISTITQLVDAANADPLRGDGHEKPLTRIRLENPELEVLAKSSYVAHSIPEKGTKVYLRESANLSTGGTAVDVTETTHPQLKTMAIRAAKIVGLDIAGVDIVTDDYVNPNKDNRARVIEVNAAPGLRMHLFQAEGKGRIIAEALVKHLFPPGVPNRVPLISVTGTNGKTTTTRLIAHILKQRGMVVGVADSDGIRVGEHCILECDGAGPRSARTVLQDQDVEIAVLETARGGLLRAGLGYDYADVAVITNVTEDHFGEYGIKNLDDLAKVKALVAQNVRRHSYVILNADDSYAAQMKSLTCGNVIYFSMSKQNDYVKKHLDNGGRAVFIERGCVIAASVGQSEKVGRVNSFPITLEGKAEHNVQNILAATAAAWSLEVNLKEIGAHLSSFYPNLFDNPGRLNFFDLDKVKVLVDYAHNQESILQTVKTVRRMGARRAIGVLSVPGDRPNESIHKIGITAGRVFDMLFIKEDVDLRGRSVGEVADLLRAGAIQGGLPEHKVIVMLSETKAMYAAIHASMPGDMVVVFYEKLATVIDSLNSWDILLQGKRIFSSGV